MEVGGSKKQTFVYVLMPMAFKNQSNGSDGLELARSMIIVIMSCIYKRNFSFFAGNFGFHYGINHFFFSLFLGSFLAFLNYYIFTTSTLLLSDDPSYTSPVMLIFLLTIQQSHQRNRDVLVFPLSLSLSPTSSPPPSPSR